MRSTTSRSIAIGQLKTSWDFMWERLQNGKADKNNHEYEYHKSLFERSLHYIENWDRRYSLDGDDRTTDEYD